MTMCRKQPPKHRRHVYILLLRRVNIARDSCDTDVRKIVYSKKKMNFNRKSAADCDSTDILYAALISKINRDLHPIRFCK